MMGTLSPEQVGEWFEIEARPMTLYARQWLDLDQAEDVVQEAFVRLMQQSAAPAHIKGWLYRAVRNLALNRLRSQGRRQCREEMAAEDRPPWFELDPGVALDARQAEAALRAMSAEDKELITLRIWGGLSLEQIASILGWSTATVFRRYREALNRIRTQMQKPTVCVTRNP
jgi:RNA polymerase sigma-70 factor, ECF subfamily